LNLLVSKIIIFTRKYYTNVVFLMNYTTFSPFFSSITVISGIIPTLPG
jgi:hypothetical protein